MEDADAGLCTGVTVNQPSSHTLNRSENRESSNIQGLADAGVSEFLISRC